MTHLLSKLEYLLWHISPQPHLQEVSQHWVPVWCVRILLRLGSKLHSGDPPLGFGAFGAFGHLLRLVMVFFGILESLGSRMVKSWPVEWELTPLELPVLGSRALAAMTSPSALKDWLILIACKCQKKTLTQYHHAGLPCFNRWSFPHS